MTTLPMQNNGQNILQLALDAAQSIGQQSNQPVPTANIGGTNILDARRQNPVLQTLTSFANSYQQMQQKQKRRQFIESVKTIMGSNSNIEDKVDNLIELKIQHGTDYDLGVDDIVGQLNKNADRSIKLKNRSAAESNKISLVDKTLGEITSGERDEGGNIISFDTEEEVRNHVMRKFGPNFADKYPQLEQAIQNKFAVDEFGYRVGEEKDFGRKHGKRVYIGNNQWKRIDQR